MSRSETPRWRTVSLIGWCTTPTASRCAANRCANNQARKENSEHESAAEKLWKSRAKNALGNRFAISTFRTASKNNRVDDRDHFLENPNASVASLRRLIT